VVPLSSRQQPTARHAVAAVHETPSRAPYVDPVGVGTGSIVQLVPSHPSASGVPPKGDAPPRPVPTAVQLVADPHDTLENAPT
jgi:hypothetical protein